MNWPMLTHGWTGRLTQDSDFCVLQSPWCWTSAMRVLTASAVPQRSRVLQSSKVWNGACRPSMRIVSYERPLFWGWLRGCLTYVVLVKDCEKLPLTSDHSLVELLFSGSLFLLFHLAIYIVWPYQETVSTKHLSEYQRLADMLFLKDGSMKDEFLNDLCRLNFFSLKKTARCKHGSNQSGASGELT